MPKKSKGKYLYCIAKGGCPVNFKGSGIEGESVYAVTHNGLAAMVSDSPVEKYSVTKENLLTHQRTVEEIMKKHYILPVSFGTVVDNEKRLLELLRNRRDEFENALGRLKDKVELGVKAFWLDMGVALKEIAQSSPEIKKLQYRVKQGGALNRAAAIKAGELMANLLVERRKNLSEQLLFPLQKITEESKDNKLFGDQMILNSAFLIKRSRLQEFDNCINDIASRVEKNVRIKYFGPVPPNNFVDLRISSI